MSEMLRINTTRLASDTEKAGAYIEKISELIDTLEEDLKEMYALAGIEDTTGTGELRSAARDLATLRSMEEGAVAKYERCGKKVEAVVESIG